MYVCMYIHTYMYLQTFVRIYRYMYMYMYICVHTFNTTPGLWKYNYLLLLIVNANNNIMNSFPIYFNTLTNIATDNNGIN